MQKLPPFFNYAQESTNDGYESIQDFFISWTIRCAKDDYKTTNPRISEYARRIVYLLINSMIDDTNISYPDYQEISITDIKTFRQWQQIDLMVEITIQQENGEEKLIVLNIENKWYSNIIDGQLSKSKQAIESFYNSRNKEAEIKHIVLFVDYSKLNDSIKTICKKEGYKFLTVDDLIEYAKMYEKGNTGNALFDAYWFMDDFAK